MCRQYSAIIVLFTAVSILILPSCSQSSVSPTSIPPTNAPASPVIMGVLVGNEGPMNEASVSLVHYEDKECVDLHSSREKLTSSQEKQLDECKKVVATIKSDSQGNYEFQGVEAGWYSLSLGWELTKRPDQLGLISIRVRDGFLSGLVESEDKPGTYVGVASQNTPFYFDGKENAIINYDYNKTQG